MIVTGRCYVLSVKSKKIERLSLRLGARERFTETVVSVACVENSAPLYGTTIILATENKKREAGKDGETLAPATSR